ncbi:MAG: cytochrome c3 family protein [Kiritimatiellia bacterium]
MRLLPAAALCALLASSCGEAGRPLPSRCPGVQARRPLHHHDPQSLPWPRGDRGHQRNRRHHLGAVRHLPRHLDTHPLAAAAADLDLFHQGLAIAHGGLTCLSCHDASNYDQFKLASGLSANHDTPTLCAQCHGPQMRDYNHGAHGGMSGHWDLSTGGRVRNLQPACHDPHVPKYQGALPAPPPVDRFMQTHSGAAAHE